VAEAASNHQASVNAHGKRRDWGAAYEVISRGMRVWARYVGDTANGSPNGSTNAPAATPEAP
jgi:hypothetical protein